MILVDDQPYARTGPNHKTIRDLAREVCADVPGQPRRMVVAVYCEGRLVPDDELNAVLDASVGDFEDLALQTQPVAALVHTTLEQADAMLDETTRIRTAAADSLDRGDQPAAMQQIHRLLEIWRQVQQSLVFSAEALGLDLDSLEAGECRFPDLVNLMKASLSDLREAMRNHDSVLIGDLLRYEMEGVFSQWQSLLRHLHQSAVERQDPA